MKTILLYIALVLLCVSTASVSGFAQTQVGGAITDDATWTKAGSPFLIVHTVEIKKGVTLTIEKGVKVAFKSDTSMLIYGVLKAVGTKESMITFTSTLPQPKAVVWGKITFLGNTENQKPAPSNSILSFCTIEYGQGIHISSMSPTISNCRIAHIGAGQGWNGTKACIYVRRGSPVIKQNQIYHNTVTPIRLKAAHDVRIEDNDVQRNSGTAVISIEHGSNFSIIGNRFTDNTTGGVKAIWANDITIERNFLIANRGTGISINSCSGVIQITTNAVVSNALQLRKRRGVGGIRIERCGESQVSILNNRIEGNGGHGLMLGGSKNIALHRNHIDKNKGYAVYVNGYGNIDAQNNYWGVAESLAIHDRIFDFYDNQRNAGRLLFEPFLSESPADIPAMPEIKVAVAQPVVKKPVTKPVAKKTGWFDGFALPDLNALIGGFLKDMLGFNPQKLASYLKNIWVWVAVIIGGGWIARKLAVELLIKPLVAGLKRLAILAFRGIKWLGIFTGKGIKRGTIGGKNVAMNQYAAYQNRKKSKTQETEADSPQAD